MIGLVKITGETDQLFVDGFVHTYQEAFAGPPYCENYSKEEVLEEVWKPHLNDGIIILALDDSRVVGFGCALPIHKSPDEVKDHVSRHANGDSSLHSSWYMSELGVLESHRLRGIGYALVKQRLIEIRNSGAEKYVFRTAAEASNSLHLYQKIGAKVLGQIQNVADSAQVLVNGSKSTQRVYLCGDCDTALSKIPS